jgi:tRNA(Ile)-lysidine synthase TilS/MesJ
MEIENIILDRPKISLDSKIQETARIDRYNLLLNKCFELQSSYLLIAHHLEDQIETMLLRESSGINLIGDSGMSAKIVLEKAILLRPLLNFIKNEILEFLISCKIDWIEDPSNKNICEYLIKNYRNVIIYCNSQKEGKEINKLMNDLQLNCCEYIDCKTPKKKRVDIIDKYIKVTDKESAITARELSKTEGLFVGYTSGAAFQAVKQYAALGEFNENSNVVIVFPDHGSRYMSKIYSDEWMQEQGFLDAENIDDSMKIEVIK